MDFFPTLCLLKSPSNCTGARRGFFLTQKDVRTGDPGTPIRSLSQTRVALTILWERVSVCARVPCSCFLRGLYRANDTVIVVLTMHFDSFYNDDCPQGSCAIILVKGGWQVPLVGVPRS